MTVAATVRELIENQRRILILRESANQDERAEARRAGQYPFFRNQELGRQLVDEITRAPQEMPLKYTVEALPIVIRELKKRGVQVARWNGQKLVVDAP